MNKLRKILEDFITEDDKKRKRIDYSLCKTIDKYEKKLRNLKIKKLKLKHLVCLVLVLSFICFSKPTQAVTKCYKDICIGQVVYVSQGLYEGYTVNILDILEVRQSDDDAEQLIDYYKYFVSFNDGTIAYLYRKELQRKE